MPIGGMAQGANCGAPERRGPCSRRPPRLPKMKNLTDIAGEKFQASVWSEGYSFGGSRNEDSFALVNGERIVGILVIGKRSGALDTHHRQERIQSRQILRERLVEIILTRGKIFTTYQLIFGILLLRIMSSVILINIIIDRILSKLRMQLARLSVQTKSAIIVNSLRNVRRLLNLRYETTATDGMYTSGRKEKHIPGIDLKPGENIGDGVVPDPLHILLGGDFLG